jgi:hypothetical protein
VTCAAIAAFAQAPAVPAIEVEPYEKRAIRCGHSLFPGNQVDRAKSRREGEVVDRSMRMMVSSLLDCRREKSWIGEKGHEEAGWSRRVVKTFE